MTEPTLEIVKDRYNIAGLKIVMTTYYQKTRRQAQLYIAQDDWNDEDADAVIDLGQEFYEEQHKYMPHVNYDTIEYVYTGSMFNRLLPDFSGCMLHSSAVVVDGYAYLFSADSGTGKSTHTQLWLKHFKNNAFIINDDKPVIRHIDGEWYVCGTPWSGKTNQNVNTRAKMGAIVFLERSENNWIEEMEIRDAIPKFFNQTVRRMRSEERMDLVLNMMEKVLSDNPLYKMGCNISDEAVITAYEKIKRTD